ncbi:MAG TPA: hypothetical protein VGO52_24490 [Hyphomonadaceae bacterium]|jgi:hypothetical protein|nr:hypothetical protein [Hyphomonadaceae bacterium]
MFRLLGLAAVLAAALSAAPAFAQEKDVIVVTGSRVMNEAEEAAMPVETYGGGVRSAGPPYVSINVPADYVIFTVTLETGTRAVEERKRELERTFSTLTTRVARDKTITVEVGQPGNSSPLETAAAKEAIIDQGDRSQIPLVFKFATRPGDTFQSVRTRAETFIEGIQVTGRAEVVTGDTQYIGVTEPKKHREELLRKIAEDTRLLQTIFGGSTAGGPPSISLTGLEGRVRTRPSGPLEVEMYLPYAIELGSPQPR